MYALRLSFRNAPDDRLIVHAALDSALAAPSTELTAQTIYEDEDSFFRRLIAADLALDTTQQLVVAVIRAIADPANTEGWIYAQLSDDQSRVLGLNLTPSTSFLPHRLHPFGFADHAQQFYDFLMRSPTPFAMVSGPAHTVTFVNGPYVRLLGRTSPEQLLGLPLREAMPELEGQLCLTLLDNALRTGLPQRRSELKSTFTEGDTGLSVDVYFDVVYQPLRDVSGRVQSIMAQATDVTERVLSRQVTEHREQKLYRLWAELDTLYRHLPVGIAVIDAKSLHLLRLNCRLAEMFGAQEEDLMGINLPQSYPLLSDLLQEAARGNIARGPVSITESCCNFTLIPTLDTQGAVETITVIAELTPQQKDLADDTHPIFSLA